MQKKNRGPSCTRTIYKYMKTFRHVICSKAGTESIRSAAYVEWLGQYFKFAYL